MKAHQKDGLLLRWYYKAIWNCFGMVGTMGMLQVIFGLKLLTLLEPMDWELNCLGILSTWLNPCLTLQFTWPIILLPTFCKVTTSSMYLKTCRRSHWWLSSWSRWNQTRTTHSCCMGLHLFGDILSCWLWNSRGNPEEDETRVWILVPTQFEGFWKGFDYQSFDVCLV